MTQTELQNQLEFDFLRAEVIETVVIEVTKEMPLDVFKQLHHIAYFMELMERLPDGRVVWDPSVISIYSNDLANAEYLTLQKDWLKIRFEVPKKHWIFQNDADG